VVRVADFVNALMVHSPVLASRVLRSRDDLGRVRHPLLVDPADATPMANEPALRDVLRRAFALASLQTGPNSADGPTPITPAVLTAAVALHDPMHRDATLTDAEICARLGLALPAPASGPGSVTPPRRPAAPVLPPSDASVHPDVPPIETTPQTHDTEEMIDMILNMWLTARELAPGHERDRQNKEIAEQARNFPDSGRSPAPAPALGGIPPESSRRLFNQLLRSLSRGSARRNRSR